MNRDLSEILHTEGEPCFLEENSSGSTGLKLRDVVLEGKDPLVGKGFDDVVGPRI